MTSFCIAGGRGADEVGDAARLGAKVVIVGRVVYHAIGLQLRRAPATSDRHE